MEERFESVENLNIDLENTVDDLKKEIKGLQTLSNGTQHMVSRLHEDILHTSPTLPQNSLLERMSNQHQNRAPLSRRLGLKPLHHKDDQGKSNPLEVPLPLVHCLQGHRSLQD